MITKNSILKSAKFAVDKNRNFILWASVENINVEKGILLYFPGFQSTIRNRLPLLRLLKTKYNVVTWDWPGTYTNSALLLSSPRDIVTLTHTVLLKFLSIHKKSSVILAGASLGIPFLLEFLAKNKRQLSVERLILLSPKIVSTGQDRLFYLVMKALSASSKLGNKDYYKSFCNTDWFKNKWVDLLIDRNSPDELVDIIKENLAKTASPGAPYVYEYGNSIVSWLSKVPFDCNVPTKIYLGVRDKLLDFPKTCNLLKNLCPNLAVQFLDCGHVVEVDQPKSIVEDLI